MALYPTFSTPEIEGFKVANEPKYRTGLYFDAKNGDLLIDGRGRIVEAGATDAWLQWCCKSIHTQYDAFLAYGKAYGADMQYVFSQTDRAACEDAIMQEVKIAVMNDPANRTIGVSDFSFKWESDSVRVGFVLLGADGNMEKVSLQLKG